MSQERQFLETLYQPTFRALGRTLLPMEVGHWLILSRIDKLLLPGSYPGPGDLALAVHVCTRPHWKAARSVMRAGTMFRMALALKTRHGAAYEHGLATWRAYVQWNTEKPIYRERSSDGGRGGSLQLNAPYWLVYLARAKARGMTEHEALGQKVKAVLWEDVAAQEECGAVVWCSEEEIGIQQFVRAAQAKAQEPAKPVEPAPVMGEVEHA